MREARSFFLAVLCTQPVAAMQAEPGGMAAQEWHPFLTLWRPTTAIPTTTAAFMSAAIWVAASIASTERFVAVASSPMQDGRCIGSTEATVPNA